MLKFNFVYVCDFFECGAFSLDGFEDENAYSLDGFDDENVYLIFVGVFG